MVKRYGAATVLSAVVTILIWSTTFAGLRAALGHFSPGHLVFLRWTITALALIVYGLISGMRLPSRTDVPRVLAAGFLGFGFYQIALAQGQSGVTAATAGFIINMSPVITTVLAVALKREGATPWTWAGLAVSVGGIAVMGAGRGGFGELGPGALLVLAAAASFSGYSLVIKPLLSRYTPLEVTTYAIVSGVAPFVAFAPGSLHALQTASAGDIATLFYLAIMPGGVAYITWSRANAGLTPGVASRLLYAIPVLNLFVAWAWIGEVPALVPLAGGIISLAGVALARIQPRPGAPRLYRVSSAASQLNMRRPVPAEEPAA